MRRVLIICAAVLVTSMTVPAPVWADYTIPSLATGGATAGGVTAGAATGAVAPTPVSTLMPSSGGGGVSSPGCPQGYLYLQQGNGGLPLVAQPGDQNPMTGAPVQPGSTLVDVYCGGTFVQTVVVPSGQAAGVPVPVSPLVLAQQALSTAPFPTLTIHTDPPSGRLVVNFPVWLSLSSGFAAVTASASAGPVTSTVTVSPMSVSWSMGDGGSVLCQGAGVPYDQSKSFGAQVPPPCGYVYRTSSANQPGERFTITATVHYQATWTVTGAAGGGALGPVDRSMSVPVTVGEIEALS